jgi:hypothetical protein
MAWWVWLLLIGWVVLAVFAALLVGPALGDADRREREARRRLHERLTEEKQPPDAA